MQPRMTYQPPPSNPSPWALYINAITKNYANFGGRARRREFWWFSLLNAIALFVLYIVGAVIGAVAGAATGGSPDTAAANAGTGAQAIGILLYCLYVLAVLIPSLALTVRRLHDTGKSGWSYLLVLIPIVGPILILVFTLQDSEPGDNRWGQIPKVSRQYTTR